MTVLRKDIDGMLDRLFGELGIDTKYVSADVRYNAAKGTLTFYQAAQPLQRAVDGSVIQTKQTIKLPRVA